MIRTYVQLPRQVYVLCLGTFINRAGTFVVPFITLYLRKELGLTVGTATLAMGAFGVGTVGAMLIGGHLADRLGRRAVMLGGLLGGAAMLLWLSTLRSPWAIIPAVAMFSLIAETYRPASSAMVSDLAPPAQREQAFTLLYVSVNLGFTIGPLIAEALARRSFQLLFWGDALTSAVYAGIIALFTRETRPVASAANPPSDHEAVQIDNVLTLDPAPPAPAALRHILANRPFIVFCLATWLLALVYLQHVATVPLYMDSIGMGFDVYSRMIALNGAMIVCLQMPLTPTLQRFHRGRLVAFSALLVAVGFGLTGVAANAWQMAATVVIWTLGEIIQAPQMSAIVADLAPKDMRGRYFGVFSVSFSAANMLGAPLGGQVLARFGPAVLWSACVAVALLSAGLYASICSHMARKASAAA